MVKKVWVWLGEGPTLQNTQIFCDLDRRGGDGGRGMASRHLTHGVPMDPGNPGRRKGRERPVQGQAGRRF